MPRDGKQNITHGHKRGYTGSPTYNSWCSMKARCYQEKAAGYDRYGGRGIQVCQRWWKFDNFLADMGERPEGMTLDRIDNDGNYEPGNCQWAAKHAQDNNRRSSRFVQLPGAGLPKTVAQWEYLGGNRRSVVYDRLSKGYDPYFAIFGPVREWKSRAV